MAPTEIECIERATLSAVSPECVEEIAGWLLPFDSGTVGRAKSAVPTTHTAPEVGVLREIEARYAARGLPTVFRLPSVAAFEGFCSALAEAGYGGERPTEVHVASTAGVARVSSDAAADMAPEPDEGWTRVFIGEGFDPVDGASRVKILSRARGSLFASVREHGQTVAAGAVAFDNGWASVHGMRTAQSCRARGLGRRVLASLARAAWSRGYEHMFLQVDASNAPARSLYRRAGFEPAWTYMYWRRSR